jgi:putative ABC transport system permease protein
VTIVTRQNLLAEKTRFLISVSGIALSVFLISFLLSLYQGWNLQVGRFVERVDADIWVAREGTTSFLAAASILSEDLGAQLAALDGVEQVDGIIVRPMKVYVDGSEQSTHLVGYETNGGAGGPPSSREGKEAPGEGEVIVDRVFKARSGAGVGDPMEIAGQDLEVVGVSSGGDFIFSQTTFVSLPTAQSLLAMEGLATFYLVRVTDPEDIDGVVAAIEDETAFPGITAFRSETFADETRETIMGNIVPILVIILALAFIVGVAITGLTIYNATVEKSREYGILKAIGFTNGYLFRLVLEQSLATGLVGFAIGASLTAIATRFVADLVPQFVTLLRVQDVGFVLGTTVVMALIAGLLPVRRIAGVDPVSVFS